MTKYPLVNNDPSNPRYGQHYYEETGTDSHGDPGIWHFYHDGAKIFIASQPQPTSGSTGGNAAPVPVAPSLAQTTAQNRAQDIAGTDIAHTPGLAPPPAYPAPAPAAPTPPPPSPAQQAQTTAQNRAQDIAGTDIARTAGLAQPAPAPVSPNPVAQNRALDIAGTDIARTAGLAPANPNDPSSITGGTVAPADGGAAHTVVHGDTMWSIAQDNKMSLSQLESLNPQIKSPELILPGERVNLGSVGGASPTATPASAGFPTTSSYPPPPGVTQAETAAKTELSGWGAPGNVPTDPIKGIMEAGKPETDPLKINNNKPHSA